MAQNPNPPEWYENDPLFFQELSSGFLWEAQVCSFLSSHDFQVRPSGRGVRTHVGATTKYREMVSLWCEGVPIHVKGREEVFYQPASFPFDGVFIDEVQNFDAKNPRPEYVICVSKLTGSMLVLDVAATRSHWTTRTDRDSVRGTYKTRYVCHQDLWQPMYVFLLIMRRRKEAAERAARIASGQKVTVLGA